MITLIPDKDLYVEYRNAVGEVRYQSKLITGEREYGESSIVHFENRMMMYPDIRYWLTPESAGLNDEEPVLYATIDEAVKAAVAEQNRRNEIEKHKFYEVK